jgi:prepilin-type processing-associated H-X9-DG protein
MGIGGGGNWLAGSNLTDASITQPAATILISEKHNADVDTACGAGYPGCGGNPGNLSDFWVTGVFLGPDADDGGWAPTRIPNGTISPTYSWSGNGVTYPAGQSGSVSTTHNNMASFCFTDGHTKAMIPSATNPDPVNQPQNNMWDGIR